MPPTTNASAILTPGDLERLERLRLSPRRRFAGRMRGERLSRQKGISLEFADYREYSIGDDLRHLDWNILARLGRPTIRTYQDEDDLAVYILLDASVSMDFGQPTKFEAARKLAVALGFVGLCGQDRVTPVVLGHLEARHLLGRSGHHSLARWANTIVPVEQKGFANCVDAFVRTVASRPGMVICLTDALDPEATRAIRTLGARGHEVVVIQILSDVDIDPQLEGDLRLLDSESGPSVEISANSEAVGVYRQNLAEHNKSVELAIHGIGGSYLLARSDADIIEVITQNLRALGVID